MLGTSGGEIFYFENTGDLASPAFEKRDTLQFPLGARTERFSTGPYQNNADISATLSIPDASELFIVATGETAGFRDSLEIFDSTGNSIARLSSEINEFLQVPGETIELTFTSNSIETGPGVTVVISDTPPVLDNPFHGLDIGSNAAPVLADFDGDGDLDALLGSGQVLGFGRAGALSFYRNVSNVTTASFTQSTDLDNPFNGTDIGSYVVPVFIDLDGDSDLDALLGRASGNFSRDAHGTLVYFENIGDISNPIYLEHTADSNPFSQIGLVHSKPSLADLDGDGDLDLLVATVSLPALEATVPLPDPSDPSDYRCIIDSQSQPVSLLRYFENTGNQFHPEYIERTMEAVNPFAGIDFGGETDPDFLVSPTLVDADNDGDIDALFGVSYKLLTIGGTINDLNGFDANNFNPSNFIARSCDANDISKDGTIRYLENIGTATAPVFVDQTDNISNFPPQSRVDTFATGAYDNNVDVSETLILPGATTLYISVEGETEAGFDFIELFDVNNTLLERLSGQINLALSLPGDTLNIRFTSDDIVTRSGVTVTISDQQPKLSPFQGIKIPGTVGDAAPALSDLDNDGDLDLLLGRGFRNDVAMYYFENIGTTGVESPYIQRTGSENPFGHILIEQATIPTLADLDGDNDMDVVISLGSSGILRYYRNTSALGQAYQPNRASLTTGTYNSSVSDLRLQCDDCSQITYTLDGSIPTTSSPVFNGGIALPENTPTTLQFLTIDDLGNPVSVVAEKYLLDTQSPIITIDTPTTGLVADINEIVGTVSDTGGSGLVRIELQIANLPFYVSRDEDGPFPLVLTQREATSNILPFIANNRINTLFFGENEFEHDGTWQFRFDDFDTSFTLPQASYVVTARAFDRAGNVTETQTIATITSQAATDLSIRSSTPVLLNNGTLSITGKLNTNRFPPIAEDLSRLAIELTITPPGCNTDLCQQLLSVNTFSDTGQYAFNDLGNFDGFSGFTVEGAYTLQTRFTGTDLLNGAQSEALPLLVGQSAGYAVIVQGAVSEDAQGMLAHKKTTNRIYKTLVERGFEPDNVYYYAYESGDPLLDAVPTRGEPIIGNIVTPVELQTKLNSSPAPFYLILVDHGDRDGNFYMLEGNQQVQLDPTTLDTWLDELEAGLTPAALAKPRFALLGFCYSGQLIEPLAGPNRIIISSAAEDEESWRGPLEQDGIRAGEFFMEELFQRLSQNQSFAEAFQNASDRTRVYTRRGGAGAANAVNEFGDNAIQHPLIEFNGDGDGSHTVGLEAFGASAETLDISQLFLGATPELLTNPIGGEVKIEGAPAPIFLDNDEHSATVTIMLNDATRAQFPQIEIRPPATDPQPLSLDESSGGPVLQRTLPDILKVEDELRCTQNTNPDQCSLTIGETTQCLTGPESAQQRVLCFDAPGTYELLYLVTDTETQDLVPVQRSLVYKAKLNNLPPEAPTDLRLGNGDHTIDPPESPIAVLFEWNPVTDRRARLHGQCGCRLPAGNGSCGV
ncbi:MAG: FG-GAP-like repeat-containing protein [Pseudomonadota bacterium]